MALSYEIKKNSARTPTKANHKTHKDVYFSLKHGHKNMLGNINNLKRLCIKQYRAITQFHFLIITLYYIEVYAEQAQA